MSHTIVMFNSNDFHADDFHASDLRLLVYTRLRLKHIVYQTWQLSCRICALALFSVTVHVSGHF